MTITTLPDAAVQLERFMARRAGHDVKVTEAAELSGGYSRIMRQYRATINGEPRRLVTRAQPPPELAFVDTDLADEWAILAMLTGIDADVCPRSLYYDADGSELGAKTIVMEFVEAEPVVDLLRRTGEEERDAQADALCALAAAIQAVDVDALPATLERPASWEAYIDACIEGWRTMEAEHVESVPTYRYLAAWLDKHRPAPAPLSLVHGEFQPSNTMLRPDATMIAVDWELARIADPREDLAWFHFISSTLIPPDLVGPRVDRICARYRELTGLPVEVINPNTLAYFTILPFGLQFQVVSHRLRDFAQGATKAIPVAYSLGIATAVQQQWLDTATRLSTSLQSIGSEQ